MLLARIFISLSAQCFAFALRRSEGHFVVSSRRGALRSFSIRNGSRSKEKRFALFIDADHFKVEHLSEIYKTLTGFGEVAWQTAYLSNKSSPNRLRDAGHGHLEVKMCDHMPSLGGRASKSCVDAHLMVDAINLKWKASQENIDAFAIVSQDSDFKVLVDDIRSSTPYDVFGCPCI